MRTPKDAEVEWLQRVADIEDEAGFPTMTGVMVERLLKEQQEAADPTRCARCGYPPGETKRVEAWANSFGDPGRAILGLRPVICELCGETHLEEIL
jgi:hypothetical protein